MDNYSPHTKHLIKEWLVGPRGMKEHHDKYKMVILEFRTLLAPKRINDAVSLVRYNMWSENGIRPPLPEDDSDYEDEQAPAPFYPQEHPELAREIQAFLDAQND